MRTQLQIAQWIVGRGGHYLLTVKASQKTLHRVLRDLTWRDVPAVSSVEAGHGRRSRCTLEAADAPAWIDFPGAAQMIRSDAPNHHEAQAATARAGRWRWSTRVRSLPMTQAQSERVAAWVQGHWTMENRLHRVRDVVFDQGSPAAAHRQRPVGHGRAATWPSASSASSAAPEASIAATRSLARRSKRAIKPINQPTT